MMLNDIEVIRTYWCWKLQKKMKIEKLKFFDISLPKRMKIEMLTFFDTSLPGIIEGYRLYFMHANFTDVKTVTFFHKSSKWYLPLHLSYNSLKWYLSLDLICTCVICFLTCTLWRWKRLNPKWSFNWLALVSQIKLIKFSKIFLKTLVRFKHKITIIKNMQIWRMCIKP